MAQRFWEYKGTENLENQTLVHCRWGNLYQAMIADPEGNLLLHLIEDSDNENWVTELLQTTKTKNGGEMLLKAPFLLLPQAFKDSMLPDFVESNTPDFPLETGVYLRSGGSSSPSFHAAIPLYYEAKKRADKTEHFVFVYVHEKHCTVFYFKDQVCELANIYPVANESEVLYFCVSALKQAGIRVDQAKVELLAEVENGRTVMKTMERFLPHVKMAHITLPYPVGEYPPYAPEAFLLYQYLQCALQVAN